MYRLVIEVIEAFDLVVKQKKIFFGARRVL